MTCIQSTINNQYNTSYLSDTTLGRKRKRLKWALAAGILIICAMFLSPVAQSRLKEVISDTQAYRNGHILTPLGFHYYLWDGAVRIFAGRPLIGAGSGGYARLMNKISKPGMPHVSQPQDTLLYMASSYGIVGVILLIFLWTLPLGAGWKRRDSLQGFAVLVFMAVLSVGSFTDTQIMSHQSGMLFAIFCGFALAWRKDGREVLSRFQRYAKIVPEHLVLPNTMSKSNITGS